MLSCSVRATRPHTTSCRRAYLVGSDPLYSFVLVLRYDDLDRLASARYVKRAPGGFGRGDRCQVIFDLPPTDAAGQSVPCPTRPDSPD